MSDEWKKKKNNTSVGRRERRNREKCKGKEEERGVRGKVGREKCEAGRQQTEKV